MNLTKTLRRAVLGIVASTAAIGGTLALSDTASADTPACVTTAEFRQAKRGMTKRQVDRIFDVHGHVKGRSPLWDRWVYPHCQRNLLVNMYYGPATMRVKNKILSTTTPKPPPPTTDNCVTDDELDQIEVGMPVWRVHDIFGTEGTFMRRTEEGVTREYAYCHDEVYVVWVQYHDHALLWASLS